MTLSPEFEKRIEEQAKAVTLMQQEDLACENILMTSKWPEYRFITPLTATKLFVVEFRKAYAACLRTNVDLEKSQRSRAGSSILFLKAGRHETNAWRARQIADALGLPYPVYLRFCLDFAMRRQRKQLPHINQLYPSADDAQKAWHLEFQKFWTEDQRQLAYNGMKFVPQLADPRSRSLPARITFVDDFLNGVTNRIGHLGDFVSRYVVSRNYVDADELAKVIGEEPVENALAILQDEIRSGELKPMAEVLSRADLLQSCLGLPGVDDGADGPCQDCPTARLCALTRQAVEKRVVAATGHSDPRKEYHAQKNRENVQAYRDRKRSKPTTV